MFVLLSKKVLISLCLALRGPIKVCCKQGVLIYLINALTLGSPQRRAHAHPKSISSLRSGHKTVLRSVLHNGVLMGFYTYSLAKFVLG